MTAEDARAEAERRWPRSDEAPASRTSREWLDEGMASGFVLGAQWQSQQPPTEEEIEAGARTLDLDAWEMDPYDYLDAYQGRAITTHDGPGFQRAARERARRTAHAVLEAAAKVRSGR